MRMRAIPLCGRKASRCRKNRMRGNLRRPRMRRRRSFFTSGRTECRSPNSLGRRGAWRRRNKGRTVKHHARVAEDSFSSGDVVPGDEGIRASGERGTTPSRPKPPRGRPRTEKYPFGGCSAGVNLVKYSHKQEVLRMFYTKPLSHPRFERIISREGERHEKDSNADAFAAADVFFHGMRRRRR